MLNRIYLPMALFIVTLLLAWPLPAWRYVGVCACMAVYSTLVTRHH